MQTITSKAQEVLQIMQDKEGVDKLKTVDPYLIIAIVGCIVSVIQLLINKHNSYKSALAIMKEPSILQRWTFRKLLREKLGDKHNELVCPVRRSMYALANGLTENDVVSMYHEVYKL